MATQDLVKSTRVFVKHHLGKQAFAPFTGQDYPAWSAFAYLVMCYAQGGGAAAITAMARTVECAQSKTWRVFVQTIPAVMDWSTVAELWPKIMAETKLSLAMQRHYAGLQATEHTDTGKGVVIRKHGLGGDVNTEVL